jgi:adenylate cyclase
MSIVQYEIRSAMCAPMYTSGEVCGLIYVDIQGNLLAFSQQDLELLTALAVFAAAGIEQARLRANVDRERKMRARLARYSSPNVVERILSGDVDVDGEMIVEEREVTVLFADLQGFTSMSENMSPSEIARVLNGIFGKLTEIIFRFEGTLDKFMGDAVMCIFGAPLTLPDHATRAVEAALAMQESLVEINEEGIYDMPLNMRIGVNSGLVVAGDLGSPERKDYTVLGDTVNVASRLESSVATAGQVVVGPQTYELTREKFTFEPLEEIQLKGKKKSVLPYRVTGKASAADE